MNLRSAQLLILTGFLTLLMGSEVETKSQITQSIEISQKENCDNPVTQTSMNICASLEYQEMDQRLNQVYQQVRAEINNPGRDQQLITAQLSWIEFRDLNCDYVADAYRGGSIQPLIYYSCLTSLTEERIQHLEQMIPNF